MRGLNSPALPGAATLLKEVERMVANSPEQSGPLRETLKKWIAIKRGKPRIWDTADRPLDFVEEYACEILDAITDTYVARHYEVVKEILHKFAALNKH